MTMAMNGDNNNNNNNNNNNKKNYSWFDSNWPFSLRGKLNTNYDKWRIQTIEIYEINDLLVQIQTDTTEGKQSQTERRIGFNDGGGNDSINKGTKTLANVFVN